MHSWNLHLNKYYDNHGRTTVVTAAVASGQSWPSLRMLNVRTCPYKCNSYKSQRQRQRQRRGNCVLRATSMAGLASGNPSFAHTDDKRQSTVGGRGTRDEACHADRRSDRRMVQRRQGERRFSLQLTDWLTDWLTCCLLDCVTVSGQSCRELGWLSSYSTCDMWRLWQFTDRPRCSSTALVVILTCAKRRFWHI